MLTPTQAVGAAGCTFHVQKAVEIGQSDAAVHRVSPVGELVIRVEPGVKVLFTVLELGQETEKERQR